MTWRNPFESHKKVLVKGSVYSLSTQKTATSSQDFPGQSSSDFLFSPKAICIQTKRKTNGRNKEHRITTIKQQNQFQPILTSIIIKGDKRNKQQERKENPLPNKTPAHNIVSPYVSMASTFQVAVVLAYL